MHSDRGQSHPAIITHKTAAEVDEEMEIEFFYDFRSSSFLRGNAVAAAAEDKKCTAGSRCRSRRSRRSRSRRRRIYYK